MKNRLREKPCADAKKNERQFADQHPTPDDHGPDIVKPGSVRRRRDKSRAGHERIFLCHTRCCTSDRARLAIARQGAMELRRLRRRKRLDLRLRQRRFQSLAVGIVH